MYVVSHLGFVDVACSRLLRVSKHLVRHLSMMECDSSTAFFLSYPHPPLFFFFSFFVVCFLRGVLYWIGFGSVWFGWGECKGGVTRLMRLPHRTSREVIGKDANHNVSLRCLWRQLVQTVPKIYGNGGGVIIS